MIYAITPSYIARWSLVPAYPGGWGYSSDFGYSSSSTIHLELKRQIRLYAPVVPLKTIPDLSHLRQYGQNQIAYSIYGSIPRQRDSILSCMLHSLL